MQIKQQHTATFLELHPLLGLCIFLLVLLYLHVIELLRAVIELLRALPFMYIHV